MEDATVAKIKENLARARAKLAKFDATVEENTQLKKDIAVAAGAIAMLEKQVAEKPVQHINNITLDSISELQQLIEGLGATRELFRDEITALRKTVTLANENSVRSFTDQLITTEENLSKGVGEVNKTLQSVDNGVKEVNSFWKKFKINIPAFPEINFKPLEKLVSNISEKITNFKISWPSKAEDAIPVRLSDGENFYKLQAQFFGTGGGGSVPKLTLSGGIQAVPVVNPDGTSIGSNGGLTEPVEVIGNIGSEDADSGNPVKVGGVYTNSLPNLSIGDRSNLYVDTRGSLHSVLFAPNSALPASYQVDDTDSMAASAQADKMVVIGRNTIWDSAGENWDRMPGNSTDGVLVDLGANNAVTVSGTVAVTQSGVWDEVGINDSGNSITVDGTVAVSSVSGTVDTELTTADLDTGGGTDTRAVVGIVGSASGGGQLIPGSATDGLLVNLGSNNDVTVTGSVTANAGTNLNTSALLTTTNFTDVLGTSSLILGTQADDVANTSDGLQTTSFGYMFDGSTWDRVRGTSTDGLLVNLGSNNDVTVTGTVAVTQSGTWDEVGINDSGNSITVDGTVAVSSITTSVTPGTAAANLGKAEDAAHSTGDTGVFMLAVRNESQTGRTDADGDYSSISVDSAQNVMVVGSTAHDTVDTKNPVKIGLRTKDLKATPAAVGADDVTNAHSTRSGVQYVIPGHPNVLTQSLQVTDADGAQTDTAIITVSAGTAIVVTKVSVTADNANTGDVSVRIGFGTANTPAADAAQMLLFHPGIAPGSGVIEGSGSGIIGIGASNEDVRITCEDPAGGSINVIVTYWTETI